MYICKTSSATWGTHKKSWPLKSFLCERTHPIPQCLPVCSLPIGLGVSYSVEEWTWWKTHLSFSNRGCANKWMGLQMKKSRMLQSCQLGCSWRMGFAKSTQRCALQESKNWKLFIFQQKHSSIEPTVGQLQPQQTLEEFHSIISLLFLISLIAFALEMDWIEVDLSFCFWCGSKCEWTVKALCHCQGRIWCNKQRPGMEWW